MSKMDCWNVIFVVLVFVAVIAVRVARAQEEEEWFSYLPVIENNTGARRPTPTPQPTVRPTPNGEYDEN